MQRDLSDEVVQTLRDDYALNKRQVRILHNGLDCYEEIRDEEYDELFLLLGEQYSSQMEIRSRNRNYRTNSAWESLDALVFKTVESYYGDINIKSPQKTLKKV